MKPPHWLRRWAAQLEALYRTGGRIGRMNLLYRLGGAGLGGYLLIALVFFATGQYEANPPVASVWIAAFELLFPLALGLAAVIAGIARRMQDLGLSGSRWPVGLLLLPLLLLWPGQKTANRYGPPP